jgi:hypothetical protein
MVEPFAKNSGGKAGSSFGFASVAPEAKQGLVNQVFCSVWAVDFIAPLGVLVACFTSTAFSATVAVPTQHGFCLRIQRLLFGLPNPLGFVLRLLHIDVGKGILHNSYE